MSAANDSGWIDDLELEDVGVKWSFSHFAGQPDIYNDEGDVNFVVLLSETQAEKALKDGWAVREKEGREEGDPVEYHLKVKVGSKPPPRIFFIKGQKKLRMEVADLADVRRDTCEQLDIILQPSRWVNQGNVGITAYLKEMYATMKESRFGAKYSDYEDA